MFQCKVFLHSAWQSMIFIHFVKGGIEKFMKKLSPAKLFESKEELKQGKLDEFLHKNNNQSTKPASLKQR